MPAFLAPLAIAGVSALGNWLGNRKKTTQQTQTGTQTGSVNTTTGFDNTSSTRPDLDPASQSYLDLIRNRYIESLNQDPDLSGYEATGVQNINRAGDLRSRALSNILTARGLNYSPMGAAALGNVESNRFSDVVNFENQIPLLRDALMRERLAEAGGFFAKMPVGQTQTSSGTTTGTENRNLSSTGTGTSTDPGNQLGGLFGGLGSTLAYLYGSGAFKPKQQPLNV